MDELFEDNMVSIQVRMPLEMRNKIDAMAERHRRTRTAEILVGLDIYQLIDGKIESAIGNEVLCQELTRGYSNVSTKQP